MQVKNYNVLYGAMLQFQRSRGGFPKMENEADPCTDAKAVTPQVTIEDHAQELEQPITRNLRGCINHILEDSRGMAKPCCCKTAPAHVGMFPKCRVQAVRCKGNKSSAYINAVTRLTSVDGYVVYISIVHVFLCQLFHSSVKVFHSYI